MIISFNWLKKYTDIDLTPEQLVELIGSRLVEVESVESLAPKFRDVVIAEVVSAQRIEGSDHLTKLLIDDASVVQGVERNEAGQVQVVCGAPNVKEGMKIAWIPPGTIVPSTFADEKPFRLDSRKVMNVMSHGMVASAKELDLYDEHEGILEIDPSVEAGEYFVDIFNLDDYLFDIENKSLTHRPDTFGVIGFAREVAGISGKKFTTPEWLQKDSALPKGRLEAPQVFIDNPEVSANYELILADGNFSVAKTPDEIKSLLSRVGVRPVNPVVDATNYAMLITGQPLHAFDYDKLVSLCGGQPELHVRYAREGETLVTLDDRNLTLDEKDIVIAANEHVVALAGAIGGKETAVDDDTKSIALESATFDLYSLRGTQMRHGIFSEAITRFTKGQPHEQNGPVLTAALVLLDKWAPLSDISEKVVAVGNQVVNLPIDVSARELARTLATDLTSDEIKETLERVEFDVKKRGDDLTITAPWWRQDIKIQEDIIEEVGRLRGYDNIVPSLPRRTFKAVQSTEFDQFKKYLRNLMSNSGGNEVLTYNFVPGQMMDWANQDKTNAYKIVNSISPELEYYRLSLMPSLLKTARMNLKQGYDQFCVFELNKVHALSRGLTEDSVPVEGYNMGGVVYHKKGRGGAEYYQAKAILDVLYDKLNIQVNYSPLDLEKNSLSMFAPFEPKRSAMLQDAKTGELLGVVGEYKKTVAKRFKLPENIAGFELNLLKLFESYQAAPRFSYRPASRYPSVERDLCFKLGNDVTYHEVIDAVKMALADSPESLETSIKPVDIYLADGADTKNITIRLTLQSHDKTLDNSLINQTIDKVVNEVQSKLGATLV